MVTNLEKSFVLKIDCTSRSFSANLYINFKANSRMQVAVAQEYQYENINLTKNPNTLDGITFKKVFVEFQSLFFSLFLIIFI